MASRLPKVKRGNFQTGPDVETGHNICYRRASNTSPASQIRRRRWGTRSGPENARIFEA